MVGHEADVVARAGVAVLIARKPQSPGTADANIHAVPAERVIRSGKSHLPRSDGVVLAASQSRGQLLRWAENVFIIPTGTPSSPGSLKHRAYPSQESATNVPTNAHSMLQIGAGYAAVIGVWGERILGVRGEPAVFDRQPFSPFGGRRGECIQPLRGAFDHRRSEAFGLGCQSGCPYRLVNGVLLGSQVFKMAMNACFIFDDAAPLGGSRPPGWRAFLIWRRWCTVSNWPLAGGCPCS